MKNSAKGTAVKDANTSSTSPPFFLLEKDNNKKAIIIKNEITNWIKFKVQ